MDALQGLLDELQAEVALVPKFLQFGYQVLQSTQSSLLVFRLEPMARIIHHPPVEQRARPSSASIAKRSRLGTAIARRGDRKEHSVPNAATDPVRHAVDGSDT